MLDIIYYLSVTFFFGCVTVGAATLLLGLIHARLVKKRYGPQQGREYVTFKD